MFCETSQRVQFKLRSESCKDNKCILQIWKFNNLGSNLPFLFTYSSKFFAESSSNFANIHFRHKYCNSLIVVLHIQFIIGGMNFLREIGAKTLFPHAAVPLHMAPFPFCQISITLSLDLMWYSSILPFLCHGEYMRYIGCGRTT